MIIKNFQRRKFHEAYDGPCRYWQIARKDLTIHKKLNIIETCTLKGKGMSSQKEKEEWADEHAHRIQKLFEQWQKPLGIDSGEYFRYLKKDLVDLCEDSLKKSLIESLS